MRSVSRYITSLILYQLKCIEAKVLNVQNTEKERRNIQCTSNALKICLIFSYGSSADIFLPMRDTNRSRGTPFREREGEKEYWVYYKALVWSACSSFTWQSSESTVFKGVISFPLACRVVIFSLSAVIEMKKVGWGVLDSILVKHQIYRGSLARGSGWATLTVMAEKLGD